MKKLFLAMILAAATLPMSMAAQVTHHTDLSWNAVVPQGATGSSPAQILTGYNVYKATASGGYTKGSPLATVPFGTNAYSDTAVTAGQTSFYVVTTLCSNCTTKESIFSTPEVKATTPLDQPVQPTPPSNLTGVPF